MADVNVLSEKAPTPDAARAFLAAVLAMEAHQNPAVRPQNVRMSLLSRAFRAGIVTALGRMNAGVRQQFSGIYRLDGDRLVLHYLVDKTGAFTASTCPAYLAPEPRHCAPIRDWAERVEGIVCHFDPEPQELAQDEIALLHQFGRMLPRHLSRAALAAEPPRSRWISQASLSMMRPD